MFAGHLVELKLMKRKLWVNQEHTQERESDAELCSQRTSLLDVYCFWHWRGDGWRESRVWVSIKMAFTCFNVSSFTKRRFCISTWTAWTRRSCTKTSLMLSAPRGSPRRLSNTLSCRPDSHILPPTSALCLPSFCAHASPGVSCHPAPAAASALWSAALAAVKSCHPHTVCLFSVEHQSEIATAMRSGKGRHIYEPPICKRWIWFCLLPFPHEPLFSFSSIPYRPCCCVWLRPSLPVYCFVHESYFLWKWGPCPLAGAWTSVCQLEEGNRCKKTSAAVKANGQRELGHEQVPALLYCWSMVCLILCLSCRASISLGRVTSSWGSVSTQEGRGGTAWTWGLTTVNTSTETEGNSFNSSNYFLII